MPARRAPDPQHLDHQSTYFDRISDRYAKGFEVGIPFMERLRARLTAHARGDVLDIGNGGLLGFDPSAAATVAIADLSAASLRVIKTLEGGRFRPLGEAELRRVRRVAGNALCLPFRAASFDAVLMTWVAHHLSVASRRESRANVATAVAEVHRVLRPGGRFVLLENCPPRMARLAQEALYGVAFRLLARVGKPLPYFLSRDELARVLARAGFAAAPPEEIPWPARVYLPIFPSLSPPGWLYGHALRNQLFVAEKREPSLRPAAGLAPVTAPAS